MSTVANEVRECIRRDPYLREGIVRDIISHAKLARWLQETRGISGTEHAIISALRRLGPMSSLDPMEEARRAIKLLDLTSMSGIVAITIRRGDRSETRIASLLASLGDEIPALPSQDTLTVIVPREQKEDAVKALGQDAVKEVGEELTLLTLADPTNRPVKTDVILSLVSHELMIQDVSLIEVFTSGDELRILINEADEQAATEAILALLDDDG